jgi:hypothetical protein
LISNSLGELLPLFMSWQRLISIFTAACFTTEQMVLFYNRLTGPIPSEIGLVKALSELHHSFHDSEVQSTHLYISLPP